MGKVSELGGDDSGGDKDKTFVFDDEGHTLGNILRYIVSGYPEVEFCAYTVPHPAESKMHFRIQTLPSFKGKALDILKRGLQDLEKLCDHSLELFQKEFTQFSTQTVQ